MPSIPTLFSIGIIFIVIMQGYRFREVAEGFPDSLKIRALRKAFRALNTLVLLMMGVALAIPAIVAGVLAMTGTPTEGWLNLVVQYPLHATAAAGFLWVILAALVSGAGALVLLSIDTLLWRLWSFRKIQEA